MSAIPDAAEKRYRQKSAGFITPIAPLRGHLSLGNVYTVCWLKDGDGQRYYLYAWGGFAGAGSSFDPAVPPPTIMQSYALALYKDKPKGKDHEHHPRTVWQCNGMMSPDAAFNGQMNAVKGSPMFDLLENPAGKLEVTGTDSATHTSISARISYTATGDMTLPGDGSVPFGPYGQMDYGVRAQSDVTGELLIGGEKIEVSGKAYIEKGWTSGKLQDLTDTQNQNAWKAFFFQDKRKKDGETVRRNVFIFAMFRPDKFDELLTSYTFISDVNGMRSSHFGDVAAIKVKPVPGTECSIDSDAKSANGDATQMTSYDEWLVTYLDADTGGERTIRFTNIFGAKGFVNAGLAHYYQSPALAEVVDRNNERDSFKIKRAWTDHVDSRWSNVQNLIKP